MKTKSSWLAVVPTIPLIAALVFLSLPPASPISPLVEIIAPRQISNANQKPYIVLGFLPYWNIKKSTADALETSTQIGFFALRLNGDGSLMTHVNRREQEPGYTNYRRQISNTNIPESKLVLTFVQKDQEALVEILQSATNRRRAIQTIVDAVEESKATGVNIDFEPLGESMTYRDQFTTFMKDLNSKLNQGTRLSLCVYPSAAARARLWDLSSLEPYFDDLVIMTYDYTLPNNDKTGPIAPLRGAGQLFEHDIIKNLAEITSIIPSRKVLLGIPFYGYEWDTDVADKYTPAESRGSLASLERVQQMIDDKTVELVWDRNTLSPYGIRREDGKIVSQIYFEDINSIKLKLDLVRQADLGGIAIWAIGYEGNNPGLWDTIASYLLLADISGR